MSLLGEKMSKINGINENVIQIGKGLEKGIFLYPSLDGLLQGILGKNTPLPYKEINGRYTDNFGGRIAKAINYTIGTAFAFVPWLVSRSIRVAVYYAPRRMQLIQTLAVVADSQSHGKCLGWQAHAHPQSI